MRIIAIAAAALVASATAAFAAPSSVTVSIGPELQAKAVSKLGQRDVNDLVKSLQTKVERQLTKTGAYDGARIELVLVDAKPNRPTFKEMADTQGLSYQSFGLGGAAIEGRAVAASGAVTPIHYQLYADDIRLSRHGSTWSDAEDAFARFAYRLGRGEPLASR